MLIRTEVEYEVGSCTPPAVMVELSRRLGARCGDRVRIYTDGRVELVRRALEEDEHAVIACLSEGRARKATRARAG